MWPWKRRKTVTTEPTPIIQDSAAAEPAAPQEAPAPVSAAPESPNARPGDEGVAGPAAAETADDLDRVIAEAEQACASKCAQISASEAGRNAELASARQEVERERAFRGTAEEQRDRAVAALKRITAQLRGA
jgi:hypothetical protein